MKLTLRSWIVAFTLVVCGWSDSPRPPASDLHLRQWLENMVWHHRFTHQEISAATGLDQEAINAALERFKISVATKPARNMRDPLLVLPYPGGRHPRIGFLEGAIEPQRETKLSIFTPWDVNSYIVADLPEAIWSNLGLTYLAHTHIPTIWNKQNIELPPLEWEKSPSGSYRMERRLPNGIVFGTLARPTTNALNVKMWLSNGTEKVLSDLRVQNCIMLKGAAGFREQSATHGMTRGALVARHDGSHQRWIISGFKPLHRAWNNPPVPCLHSDPKFPDTAPGKTSTVTGLITFYSGTEIDRELERLNDLPPPSFD